MWRYGTSKGAGSYLCIRMYGRNAMKKLAVVLAVAATAFLGSTAANAADHSSKMKATDGLAQITDFSSRHRNYRVQRFYRHSYRPYRSYGYYPQPYYRNYGYAPQPYYGGGPVVSFSFGGGRGGGWGHRW
jgi:hypothetical protein